ncbi:MAG: CHASE2 domain-containing protein [Phormidesmis sp.]
MRREPSNSSSTTCGSPPRYALLAIAFAATAFTYAVQCLGILQILEWAILDQWFRRRPAESYTPPIVIIAVNDNDIAANGEWPLSDQKLAQLLTQVKSYEPAAIGLDLYRDFQIAPGYQQLEQVFLTTPNLIGIEKVVGEGASLVIPPPPTLNTLGQVAFSDLVLDSDGHVRRHLLSLRHQEQTKLALGTRLALLYLEQQAGIVPESLENQRMSLGKAEFLPLNSNAGAYHRVDTGGYQILADYLIPTQGIPIVSMQTVINNEVPTNLFRQKIVFIGVKSDSSWGDRFYTPYSLTSDQSWSGVEIHANLTAQLISSAIEARAPLRPFPEAIEWLWVLSWSTLGMLSNRNLSFSLRQWWRLPGLLAILVIVTYLIFLGHYWLPLIPSLIGVSVTWFGTQSYLIWHRLRQENFILEQTIQARTQALDQQNQALEQARSHADLANQAKSKFLAHISHELRTPLTAILGFGDLLENSSNLPKNEKEYAETISQCGEHLLSLINNVLELSKIETGSTKFIIESVDLPHLLNDVQKMFKAQLNAKQLTLQVTLADTVPRWIEADSNKLRQVVINLLGNAVKFTEVGYVHLDVQANASSNTQDTLEFIVEDTGPGLKAEEIALLFDPFVQASAGKKIGKGTGLGLALSRQCVELMGGEISVSSTYGQGSRFSFQIPLRPTNPLAIREQQPSSQLLMKTDTYYIPNVPEGCRMLIVDDEINNQRLLTQWLTEAQFDVKTANTGEKAVQIFKQWHPHFILLDVHLPDFDGYEVARRIREAWENSSQEQTDDWIGQEEPVILAITAGVLQNRLADLLAAGCDDVLWKPIKRETLAAKIAEYCVV